MFHGFHCFTCCRVAGDLRGHKSHMMSLYRRILHARGTVEYRYNAVQYDMILCTVLQWLKQNMNKRFYPQNSSHISPSRASYGVSVVRIREKTGRVITLPHSISSFRIDKHTETCTKWTAFSRRYFQMFYSQKIFVFDSTLSKICSLWFYWQYVTIGSSNGLAPNGRHAITWTNVNQGLCCHLTPLCHTELKVWYAIYVLSV